MSIQKCDYSDYIQNQTAARWMENIRGVDRNSPIVLEKDEKIANRLGFDNPDLLVDFLKNNLDIMLDMAMGRPINPGRQRTHETWQRNYIIDCQLPLIQQVYQGKAELVDLCETCPSAITVRNGLLEMVADVEKKTFPKAFDNMIEIQDFDYDIYLSLKHTDGQGGHQTNAATEVTDFMKHAFGTSKNNIFIAVVGGTFWTDKMIKSYEHLETDRVLICKVDNLAACFIEKFQGC